MPDLIPVDHDPFNDAPTNLIPVDHDPWAAAGTPGPGQMTDADRALVRRTGAAIAAPIDAVVGSASRAMAPNPYPPGSEEWSYYEDSRTKAMTQGAGDTALAMVGGGTPFAERGALGAAGGGIKAFHGSPYDFDAFDMSKIGTGEGAQAYGHGLYFAENEETAKQYRKMLGRGDQIKVGDQSVDKMYGDYYDQRARNWVQQAAKTSSDNTSLIDDAIAKAQADLDYMRGPSGGKQAAESAQKTLDRLQEWKQKGVSVANPGKMYEVNINADPEHFLDWDKPLSEHSPEIQNKVRKTILPELLEDYDRSVKEGMPLSSAYRKYIGAGTYKDYDSSNLGAMHLLHEAGIPGIKYLDQGSRGAGNGTRNYVVFNDKLIDIIKKYGLAGLIAGGAAHFKTQQVDHDPFEALQ